MVGLTMLKPCASLCSLINIIFIKDFARTTVILNFALESSVLLQYGKFTWLKGKKRRRLWGQH